MVFPSEEQTRNELFDVCINNNKATTDATRDVVDTRVHGTSTDNKNEDDERAARSPCDEAKADLIYSRAATGESVHRCDNLVAIVS